MTLRTSADIEADRTQERSIISLDRTDRIAQAAHGSFPPSTGLSLRPYQASIYVALGRLPDRDDPFRRSHLLAGEPAPQTSLN